MKKVRKKKVCWMCKKPTTSEFDDAKVEHFMRGVEAGKKEGRQALVDALDIEGIVSRAIESHIEGYH